MENFLRTPPRCRDPTVDQKRDQYSHKVWKLSCSTYGGSDVYDQHSYRFFCGQEYKRSAAHLDRLVDTYFSIRQIQLSAPAAHLNRTAGSNVRRTRNWSINCIWQLWIPLHVACGYFMDGLITANGL